MRYEGMELPVKLKVHESVFVPLAKWAMLIGGNYRCVTKDGMIPIKEAVHRDLGASRAVYDWVVKLCVSLGADEKDLVPFGEVRCRGARPGEPSPGARALFGGAPNIERVDRLVQGVAARKGMRNAAIDEVVALVDARLSRTGAATQAAVSQAARKTA